MEATEVITSEVHKRIRDLDVDPRADTQRSRELIRTVIAEYDERSLVADLPLLEDKEATFRHIDNQLSGFGALQDYFDDPHVEEIWVNSPSEVFIAVDGIHQLTTTKLSSAELDDLIERMLRTSGRRVDLSQPFVDAILPDGSRLHVVLPDITRTHPAVNIRKFIARPRNLANLVAHGSLTPGAAEFLDAAVACGANILVSGATQAGKTTMLNALAGSIPARERTISCEEVFELNLPSRDWVPMQCRQPSLEGTGEVTLRALVKEALRMRPTRIIVGEVREAESLDMLIALNSGLAGMSTLHANSARAAITKICTLPLLAGANISSAFVVPTVAVSLDVVVHLRRDPSGVRRVDEICAVPGGVEGDVVELDTIFHSPRGQLIRGQGFGHLGERFAGIGRDLHSILEAA
ncbi:CpaF family protein [Brevibacterium limosum]|uniref:CpaF family protein n=1 Tax=Brevibacterium limosum TaxID=2697565 RepID=UPI0014239159|nr:ATPase, T2SS/T4P/T4SS family [Brevibacterium limosum]